MRFFQTRRVIFEGCDKSESGRTWILPVGLPGRQEERRAGKCPVFICAKEAVFRCAAGRDDRTLVLRRTICNRASLRAEATELVEGKANSLLKK